MGGEDIPLLDSVEALEGWDGDKDDNCLLAVANFDLISRPQVSMRAPGCLPILGPLPVLFHEQLIDFLTSFYGHRARRRLAPKQPGPPRLAVQKFPSIIPILENARRVRRAEDSNVDFPFPSRTRWNRISYGHREIPLRSVWIL